MGTDFVTQTASELPDSTEQGGQAPYCLDRRLALETLALAAGGLALQLMLPATADAKRLRVNYPIRFVLNGGTNPDSQIRRVRRGHPVMVSELKKPRRKGYTFKGWYRNRKLTKKATVLRGVGAKSKRTVFAKWKPIRYEISYVLNGGSFAKEPRRRYTIESKEYKLPTPVRSGYQFMGWFLDRKYKRPKRVIKAGAVGNVKLYAKWQVAEYSIQYDLDGGEPVLALPTSYTKFTGDVAPFPPTKPGYRFIGWYADAEGTEARNIIKKGSTGDITLHAKWASLDYWEEQLEERCARIAELEQERESGPPSFLFITDMHLPTNALVSPYLARRVIEQTSVNTVVFGGDILNGPVRKTDVVSMVEFIRDSFGEAQVYFVRGNHDANNQGTAVESNASLTDTEFALLTSAPDEMREDGALHYCVDDEDSKMRYVIMDSGAPYGGYVKAAQLEWLGRKVLELEEGWSVLVFVHEAFAVYRNSSGGKYVSLGYSGKQIRDKLDSVYDEAKALVVGVISGHCHRDHVEYSDKGYPIVATTCDVHGRQQDADPTNMSYGTTREQAFDVVTINMEETEIHFTRIGAGKSRTVSFAPKVVEPDEPDEPVEPVEPIEESDTGKEALTVGTINA